MTRAAAILLAFSISVPAGAQAGPEPIKLHPENPHYFLFRGKPAVLVTSGEHYGAVMNLEFDTKVYLTELAAHGFNLTRTFSGTYREAPGFGGIITGNPMAPPPLKYLCPWARSETPGYYDGGNKFDLTRWDPAYFERLKDFVKEAGKRGIVVEVVLFCGMYDEGFWKACPMHPDNNVNGLGKGVAYRDVLSLVSRELLEVQDNVARKIVQELNAFDNVYYELCNEPYLSHATDDWQRHMAETVSEAEKALPNRHLIAQNVALGRAADDAAKAHPAVSIINLHYASRATRPVKPLYGLNKVVAYDETGDDIALKKAKNYMAEKYGNEDWDSRPYRLGSWTFLMEGGGVYDHLDFSFTTKHPDGSALYVAPGGGGPHIRRQLRILKEFMESLDVVKMAPHDDLLVGGLPEGVVARVLAEPGKTVAVYLRGGEVTDLKLELPAGAYRAEWIDPKTGKTEKDETVNHSGGAVSLAVPKYSEDVALRLRRRP